MNKKAFTLIELLVVIAIIAILAAILFPVFAQAKLAAKKAASLSNVKQIALGEIMYSGDYDDNFVMASQNVNNDACGIPNANAEQQSQGCHLGTALPSLDWPLLLQPYIKSLGIYVDPGTGDPQGIFGSGVNSYPAAWNGGAQYGYNYEFLAPITATVSTPLNGNSDELPTTLMYSQGRTSSAAVKPAETVMFTMAQTFATPNTSQFSLPDFDEANAPGIEQYIVPSPTHLTYTSPTCFSSSNGCAYGNWFKQGTGGPNTADVRALQPYNGSNVAWVDGHAKSMSADALAIGTDYSTATQTSNPGPYGTAGCIVTNLTTYLWSLDGTLTDVK